MRRLVHVPPRIILKRAHARSGAEVVNDTFVVGGSGSRAFMDFHTANRVREHIYLPEEFSDLRRIQGSDGLRFDVVAQTTLLRGGRRLCQLADGDRLRTTLDGGVWEGGYGA